jgi:uncharacterized protein (TIGR02145 family)
MKIKLFLLVLCFISINLFSQIKDLSNSKITSIPEKFWSKNLQQLIISGNPIAGSEIVLFNLSSPETIIIYSDQNNKVDTLPEFNFENSNSGDLIKSLKEKNLATIVKLANYYHAKKQTYLVTCLYQLTDSLNIDYKTRTKIINTIYQNNQNYAASSIADKITKDTSINDVNVIHEIADYFEKKELYSQSISMYKKIGYNINLKNTSQSLYALYSIANILEKNEKNDSTIRLYSIYEDVCFAKPSDEEALKLVEQGCKKCWKKAQTEIPYLKNLYKEYAQKKENRIKAGATTKTVGTVVNMGTSIASSFIPGVGGLVTSSTGNFINTSTNFAGSLIEDTRNLDRIMQAIDNQIARINNRAKSIMTKIDLDKESIDKYNGLLTNLGIKNDIPYIEVPTQFDTIYDYRDKQVYRTVKVGDTWWMLDDLMFKTKNSGSLYDKNIGLYGYRHDFATYSMTDAKKACPSGWSLPDSVDWNNLLSNLGGSKYATKIIGYGGLVDFNLYNSLDGSLIDQVTYWSSDSIAYTFTKSDELKATFSIKYGLKEGLTVYSFQYFYYSNFKNEGFRTGLFGGNPWSYLPNDRNRDKVLKKAVRCVRH